MSAPSARTRTPCPEGSPAPAARAAFRASLLATACVVSIACANAAIPQRESPRAEWAFTALLDGKPIGTHRFLLEDRERPNDEVAVAAHRQQEADSDRAARTLTSEAQFDVKLFGLTVYRYRHVATERWQGDCLRALDAYTDDGGTVTSVKGRQASGSFAIEISSTAQRARKTDASTRCLVTFAYWNPDALRAQRQLLDPSSGRIEPVGFTPLGEGTVDVRGESTRAQGWRIVGLSHPIDVWYVGDRWVGLDTTVDGARRLSYRLR
jgi:hypothetical protein